MVILNLAVLILFLLCQMASSTNFKQITDKANKPVSDVDVLSNESNIPRVPDSVHTDILTRVKRQYLYPLNKGRRNYQNGRIIISGVGAGTGRAIRFGGYGARDYGSYGYGG